MQCELVLVRHGETSGQSSIRLNGKTDVPLSELGRQQMRAVGTVVAKRPWDRVLSSPLVRSVESAQIATGQEPHIVAGFEEINFGRWETWTWAEVQERDPQGYARYRAATSEFQFPTGDSRTGFYNRIRAAAETELLNAEGRVLAVLHKGVCKVIMATLLGLTWEQYRPMPCDLASIHRLERTSAGWRLTAGHDVSHLPQSLRPQEH